MTWNLEAAEICYQKFKTVKKATGREAGGGPDGPSSYGWSYSDGSSAHCSYRGCHANFLNPTSSAKKVSGYYSYVQSYDRCDPRHLRALKYLLDPKRSPFRSLLPPERSIIASDGTDLWSIDYVRRKGFIFADMGASSQLAINMAITGRIGYEFPSMVANFNLLLDEGIHPTIAWLWKGCVRREENTWGVVKDWSDCGFDNLMVLNVLVHSETVEPHTDAWVRAFVSGVPAADRGTTLGEAPGTTTINDVWSAKPRYNTTNNPAPKLKAKGLQYHVELVDRYPNDLKITCKRGYEQNAKMSPALYNVVKLINGKASLLNVLRGEQARFGLDDDADWHKEERYIVPFGGEAASSVEQDEGLAKPRPVRSRIRNDLFYALTL